MSNGFFAAAVLIGGLLNISVMVLEKRSKKKYVKYIPAAIGMIAAFACYMKAFYYSVDFEGAGYFIISVILGAASFASLVTSIVLDITKRKKV